jgi:hypothetical protein
MGNYKGKMEPMPWQGWVWAFIALFLIILMAVVC